jgi:hypothetical protein
VVPDPVQANCVQQQVEAARRRAPVDFGTPAARDDGQAALGGQAQRVHHRAGRRRRRDEAGQVAGDHVGGARLAGEVGAADVDQRAQQRLTPGKRGNHQPSPKIARLEDRPFWPIVHMFE